MARRSRSARGRRLPHRTTADASGPVGPWSTTIEPRRLLFVDDEVPILRALERTFRAQRREWECQYVDDPVRALDVVDSFAPDAVVSDMLMPGLDGARFLAEAARRRPAMARFILSGEVGAGSLVRMAGAAHQCLAKPCRADVLLDVLRRALIDVSAVTEPALAARLYSMLSVPVPASLIETLRGLLAEAPTPARDHQAIALVAGSAGLTTKLLQVATWTRLGLGAAPAHAHDAYLQLGPDSVASLLVADLIAPLAEADATPFQRDVWRRSAHAAAAAEAIAQCEGFSLEAARESALVALWSTAAPLLLDAVCRDDYAALRQAAHADGGALPDLERRRFGLTAAQVFARMLRLWGLPATLADWTARGDDVTALSVDRLAPDAVAHLARLVVDANDGTAPAPASRTYLQRLGVGGRVPLWCAAAARALDAHAA